jgi:hypothetical protein
MELLRPQKTNITTPMRTNIIFTFACIVALSAVSTFSFGQSQGMIVFNPQYVCVGEVVQISPVCPVNNNNVSLNLTALNPLDYEIVAVENNGVLKVKFLRAATYTIIASTPNCTNTAVVKDLTVHPYAVSLPSATISLKSCADQDVTLSIPGYDKVVSWHDASGTLLMVGYTYNAGKLQHGNYSYKARVWNPGGDCIPTGTFINEATIAVAVDKYCDDYMNWIETFSYDDTKEISHSKAYFDITGEGLQSQSKSYATGAIYTNETVKDKFDRTVISTLPVPLPGGEFGYRKELVRNQAGAKYDYKNIGEAFDQTTPGTIGWYYSDQNNLEDNVPVTGHPYSRSTFYNDGSTEQKLTGGAGEKLGIGSGHEVLSGSFPVFSELEDYLVKRSMAIPGIAQDNNLRNEGVVNIGRDQNGKYAISVTDREGKTVMTALTGSQADNTLAVTNAITSSGNPSSPNFRRSTYFYLLAEQTMAISGSADFVVENIVTDERKLPGQTFAGTGGLWPAGFYRIILDNSTSEISFQYTNYFKDVSYQFFDDAGRLKTAVSPNGMAQLKQGTAFNLIDKTDYTYNFRGWLLEAKEPDAGTSKFQYRKDGMIRFSQNAQQALTGRFSYTTYDQLGRPVESGEYIGSQKTYASSAAELEYATQVSYSTGDKKDWIATSYDVADQEFISAWASSPYKQTFMRGAVSTTRNVNSKIWYSYDDMGRATWIAQKPTNLNLLFVTTYQYNFLGSALRVSNFTYDWTSHALVNQFHHYYEYDADQRLAKAYTSFEQDGAKKLRATYFYYLHGPLKRIELGDKLQGIDFVYNIQGWLTQINHPLKAQDPGNDTNDAFGMILDYYESDIPNLLSGKVSPRNPLQHHGLPAEMMAGNSYKQPLPRFMPEVPVTPAPESVLKKYSAENPVYNQMISTVNQSSAN